MIIAKSLFDLTSSKIVEFSIYSITRFPHWNSLKGCYDIMGALCFWIIEMYVQNLQLQ